MLPKRRKRRMIINLSIEGGDTEIPTAELKVYRVRGKAAISKLFRYEIDLIRVKNDAYHPLSAEQVIGKSATLSVFISHVPEGQRRLKQKTEPHKFHGIIEEFRELSASDLNGKHYRLTIVPRLAKLAHNRQSRIHATSEPQILQKLIRLKLVGKGADYRDETSYRAGLTIQDVRLRIENLRLPKKRLSHITQYDETDLDFICRLCENYGVYFFFEADESNTRDIVTFGNTNTPFSTANLDLTIELFSEGRNGLLSDSIYNPDRSIAEGNLLSFEQISRPTPRRVRVIDYNPGSTKPASATRRLQQEYVADTGLGTYTDHHTHFSSDAEGTKFARTRYEEIYSANNYYVGITSSPFVTPGRVFRRIISDSDNPKYLVTHSTIEIAWERPDPVSGETITDPDGQILPTNLRNEFRCIDFDESADPIVFRPPRVTPVPRLSGVYTAQIDASSVDTDENERPQLDVDGCYRIRHYFDERENVPAGQNSIPVRKAEPYAGENVGQHFPLKRETEVIVTYCNGDPDRPIITSALPNQTTPSPVVEDNQTAHLIKTSSGALFEINDAIHDATDVQSRILLRSRANADSTYLRLGYPDKQREGVYNSELQGESVSTEVMRSFEGIYAYTPDNINSQANKTYSRSVVQHLLSGTKVIIHAGAEATENLSVVDTDNDMLLRADGKIKIEAIGDVDVKTDGNMTVTVDGDKKEEVEGGEDTWVTGDLEKHIGGSDNKIVLGADNKLVVGNSAGTTVGGKQSMLAGGEMKIFLGLGQMKMCLSGANIKFVLAPFGFDMKPYFQANYYVGLKLETIRVAEIKKITVGIKTAVAQLKSQDIFALRGNITLNSITSSIIQTMMKVTI